MSKFKLDNVGYFEPLNIDDFNSLKSFVCWLEFNKIRFFSPNDREALNIQKDDESWNAAFQKYLNDLGIDNTGLKAEIVDGLLNLALELEMDDIQTELNVSDAEIAALGEHDVTNMSQIDINSSEFLKNLQHLSTLLRVPFNEQEPLITLRAMAILLRQMKFKSERSLSTTKIEQLSNIENEILDGEFFRTKKSAPELNRAFNLLRLLYVSDLRDLQNTINAIIVQIQAITANPKTDSSLGKVGV